MDNTLSILMRTLSFIKISHMVEDLLRFPCLHLFGFSVALVDKSGMWKSHYRCQSVCEEFSKYSYRFKS